VAPGRGVGRTRERLRARLRQQQEEEEVVAARRRPRQEIGSSLSSRGDRQAEPRRSWDPGGGAPEEELDEDGNFVTFGARVRRSLQFWKDIGASPVVLKWIEEGYDVPLRERPPTWCEPNGKGVMEHEAFLREHIPELLHKGVISEVSERPWGVSAINVVPKSNGKFRLVWDGRFLNDHLRDMGSFRMETLARMRNMFEREDWLLSMDLSSGYHHLEIRPEDRTLLGFSLFGRWFQFNALPFGLKTAPLAFSKMMGQLAKFWRGDGIRLSYYLDDWIFCNQDRARAREECKRLRADFKAAGVCVNLEKSVLEPAQCIKHLGFLVDTQEGSFSLPEDRKQKIRNGLQALVDAQDGQVRARELAAVAGRLQSCALALGSSVRIFTREMYAALELRPSWRGMAPVTQGVVQEALMWLEVLDCWDGQCMWEQELVEPRVLWVDASDSAVGGWQDGVSIFRFWERFSAKEAKQSSAFRELLGILKLLQLLVEQDGIHHEQVLIWTDSDNAQIIVEQGSSKPKLNKLAAQIFLLCAEHSLFLRVRWVPREKNVKADIMSKQLTSGCWGVRWQWFEELERRWGPHDIDRCAATWNAKLRRFNSKFRCAGAEAVDCFTQDWGGANNYVCPDFHMMLRILHHVRRCRASATIVIPYWPEAAFWPLLWSGDGWTDWVKGVMWFPEDGQAFHPEHEGSMLGLGAPSFRVLAVRLEQE